MKFRFQVFVVVAILLFSSSISFTSINIGGEVETNKMTNPPTLNIDEGTEKLQGGLQQYMESNIVPDNFTGRIMVYSNSQNIGIESLIPEIKLGNTYLHFIDNTTPEIVRKLYLDKTVKTVIPDFSVDYSDPIFQSVDQNIGQPSGDSFQAKDILQTQRVHQELGYTGSGVRIGVIDSGVDFGISDLTDSAVIDSDGYLASFDVTGTGLAITSLTLEPEQSQGKEILPLADKTLDVFLGAQGRIASTDDLGIPLEDLIIDNLAAPSVSGNYKVGIAAQESLVEGLPSQYFLFVLADTVTAGLFDTMYVDFETSLAISLVQAGIIIPSTRTYQELSEYNLTNDEPFGANNPITAKDITGDGINDVSMGGLGSIIDFNGLSGDFIFKGIHPTGSAIAMFFDPVGHGTLVASSAAGDGNTNFPIFDDKLTDQVENDTLYQIPGSAPDAKIVGHKAFSLSEFVLGWLWTGGMELELQDDGLVWVPQSDNLVDISSNSWGDGTVASNGFLKGFDQNSMLLDFLSTPSSLYSGYPGVIFVVAGGNGAPGYGTTASPGMASMAITVGASTYYHFLNGSEGRNDVAWFSARGPASYGTLKPDIVTPGHTGYVNVQVIQGYGNGTYASGTFGGTSEATPRASGVLALIMEAMIDQGIVPSFEQMRVLLKSTATDLGFDPTQQGAGLVNAFKAVSAVVEGIPIVTSTYGSQLIAENLGDAYFELFEVDHPLVLDPIDDFVTTITPEQLNSGINLNFQYSNGTDINAADYEIEVTRAIETTSENMTFQTNSIEVDQDISQILPEADLNDFNFMELSMSITKETWNLMAENGLQTPDVILYDRQTGDIIADITTFVTWGQIFFSGIPSEDFEGIPAVKFIDPGYDNAVSSWPGMNYNVSARYFEHLQWSDLTVGKNSGSFSLELSSLVSEYQSAFAQISVGGELIKAPIIISPSHNAEYAENLEKVGADIDFVQPYNQHQTVNTFDWGFRPESGDFNHYRISVPDNATYLAAFANWTSEGLLPNMYLFNSSGILMASSDVNYIGGGFYDASTSEPNSQNLLIEAEDDVYYLMIHTTQLPYSPGPFNINVFFRYLTVSSLPTPSPAYSQDLNGPITGNLNVNASSYGIIEFPEFKINRMSAQIYQGGNYSETTTILNEDLIQGFNRNFAIDQFDQFYVIDADAGEKVYVKLSWESNIDADIYVFKQTDEFNRENDLLNGLGTTIGNSAEEGIFSTDEAGSYVVFIDYIIGAEDGEDFTFTFEYDSRIGPTLTSDHPWIDIDSSLFPDDNYGILLTFGSNFGYEFTIKVEISSENSEPFTIDLNSPGAGEVLSGQVEVTWSSSRPTEVDVILIKDGVQILLGTASRSADSFTFNSQQYDNGNAELQISSSDGIYSRKVTVPVVLDNNVVSELPDIEVSESNDLPLNFIPLLSVIIVTGLVRRTRFKI